MRVQVITGGSDLPESHLLIGLARAGVDLEVTLNPASPQRTRFLEAGIPLVDGTFKSRIDPGAIRRLRARWRADPPNLVHCFTNRALGNALWASRGLPIRHIAYRGRQGNVSRWDPASWITYLHPRLDRIVCVSNAVRDSLLEAGLAEERVVTIYKGHDPVWYPASVPPPDLSAFGIPPDAFVVGCAANLRASKGADLLIRAIHHLTDHPTIHFLLMGTLRDERLVRMAGDPGIARQIHLAGYRRDARQLLGVCNLCVMASRTEGLPKGVIEAMAQGVPAVVTRVGGMAELVKDGESGLVVPPEDPAALATAIASLAADPERCSTLGRQARQRIVDRFNLENTVAATLALYREVAGGR